MNPIDTPHDGLGAHDALYDQIERELAALTTAPLDGDDLSPCYCVDEFSNEFLNWSAGPPGRLPGSAGPGRIPSLIAGSASRSAAR